METPLSVLGVAVVGVIHDGDAVSQRAGFAIAVLCVARTALDYPWNWHFYFYFPVWPERAPVEPEVPAA